MNFMFPPINTTINHKRKGSIMTAKNMYNNEIESAELLKLRREKRKERRRQQMSAFYDNMRAQTSDKLIFLFDNDLNIA